MGELVQFADYQDIWTVICYDCQCPGGSKAISKLEHAIANNKENKQYLICPTCEKPLKVFDYWPTGMRKKAAFDLLHAKK